MSSSNRAAPMTTAHHRSHLALLALGMVHLAACASIKVAATVAMVDGHQVEIATAGDGGAATIVFESGLGNDWTSWDEVASEVARHAPIFAYSRPGYGTSSPATTQRDRGCCAYDCRADRPSGGVLSAMTEPAHDSEPRGERP